MNCPRLETLISPGASWQTNVDNWGKAEKTVENGRNSRKVTSPQEMQRVFAKRRGMREGWPKGKTADTEA